MPSVKILKWGTKGLMSVNPTIDSISAKTLESTTTDSAPLIINSNQLVSNLNAEYISGKSVGLTADDIWVGSRIREVIEQYLSALDPQESVLS